MQHAAASLAGGADGARAASAAAAVAATAAVPATAAASGAAAPQRAEAGLLPGQLVANKWRLVARIGRGAFGDIFVATCATSAADDPSTAALQGRRFAIKLEKLPPPDEDADGLQAPLDEKAQAALAARAVLKLEAVILSKLQKYPFVGRFVEYGRDTDLSVAYLVMSLLGENLLRLRRRRKDGKFSLPTILRFGIQAIRSIQAVHEVGFLHRDIKPSNFVIGSNRNTTHGSQTGSTAPSDAGDALELSLMSPSKICIIDFGLARAFRDRATGAVLPSRGSIRGFRGTPRYASVHVHREEDLSRRDDLWSLFYILVEFCTGDLPWGAKRDKDEIGALKEKYMSLRLLKTGAPGDCPSCLVPFMQHLYSLSFTSKPNYAYLVELLQHKLRKMGYGSCEGDGAPDAQGEDAPFDWLDTSTLSTMDASIDATTATTGVAMAAPAATGTAGVQVTRQLQPAQPQPLCFDIDVLPSPVAVYSEADGGGAGEAHAEASPSVPAQLDQELGLELGQGLGPNHRHAIDAEHAGRTPMELQQLQVPQHFGGSGSLSFSVFGGGGGGGGGGGAGGLALPSDSCSSLSAAPGPQVSPSLALGGAALHPPSASLSSPLLAPAMQGQLADSLPLASPVASLHVHDAATPAPASVSVSIACLPRSRAHSASAGALPSPFFPSPSSVAAAPVPSAFGSLPLAQPIPVPATVILSPRKAHAQRQTLHVDVEGEEGGSDSPAAAAAAAFGAAGASAAAGSAPVSAAPAPPLSSSSCALGVLRPTPPAGMPPPHSARSFGRFHRRFAERSPSKPLPLARAQQIIMHEGEGEGEEMHVALEHIRLTEAHARGTSLDSAFALTTTPPQQPAPAPPPDGAGALEPG